MRFSHARRLLAGIVAVIAAGATAQAAQAAPAPPPVPPEIAVEEGHKPFLIGHAVGVQIYTCTATHRRLRLERRDPARGPPRRPRRA